MKHEEKFNYVFKTTQRMVAGSTYYNEWFSTFTNNMEDFIAEEELFDKYNSLMISYRKTAKEKDLVSEDIGIVEGFLKEYFEKLTKIIKE